MGSFPEQPSNSEESIHLLEFILNNANNKNEVLISHRNPFGSLG